MSKYDYENCKECGCKLLYKQEYDTCTACSKHKRFMEGKMISTGSIFLMQLRD